MHTFVQVVKNGGIFNRIDQAKHLPGVGHYFGSFLTIDNDG